LIEVLFSICRLANSFTSM